MKNKKLNESMLLSSMEDKKAKTTANIANGGRLMVLQFGMMNLISLKMKNLKIALSKLLVQNILVIRVGHKIYIVVLVEVDKH